MTQNELNSTNTDNDTSYHRTCSTSWSRVGTFWDRKEREGINGDPNHDILDAEFSVEDGLGGSGAEEENVEMEGEESN